MLGVGAEVGDAVPGVEGKPGRYAVQGSFPRAVGALGAEGPGAEGWEELHGRARGPVVLLGDGLGAPESQQGSVAVTLGSLSAMTPLSLPWVAATLCLGLLMGHGEQSRRRWGRDGSPFCSSANKEIGPLLELSVHFSLMMLYVGIMYLPSDDSKENFQNRKREKRP